MWGCLISGEVDQSEHKSRQIRTRYGCIDSDELINIGLIILTTRICYLKLGKANNNNNN